MTSRGQEDEEGQGRSLITTNMIDSILDERQSDPNPDVVDEHIAVGGPVGQWMVTPQESTKVQADIYGRQPPEIELRERRLAALEYEIGRLPPERRSALQKAHRSNPPLFYSAVHVKLMLNAEDFDPREAANQMTHYWQKREEMFGDRAFSDFVFASNSRDDCLRYYEKCVKAVSDQDSDEDTLLIAEEYLHCVNVAKVDALDRIIESAPMDDKVELIGAQEQAPDLVASYDHKLLFLTCEDFDEAKAATRMMKYWKVKNKIFGPDIVHRYVKLDDMKSHIFELEQQGIFRLMPGTDAFGRTIMVFTLNELRGDGWTEEGMSRFLWFVVHAALERESCRMNGMVLLMNYIGGSAELVDKREGDVPFRLICSMFLFHCAPVKIRAMHIFFGPAAWWQHLIGSLFSRLSRKIKKRMVVHLGEDEETLSVLEQQFGIPADQVPSELGGEVTRESWIEWIEERKAGTVELVGHEQPDVPIYM